MKAPLSVWSIEQWERVLDPLLDKKAKRWVLVLVLLKVHRRFGSPSRDLYLFLSLGWPLCPLRPLPWLLQLLQPFYFLLFLLLLRCYYIRESCGVEVF